MQEGGCLYETAVFYEEYDESLCVLCERLLCCGHLPYYDGCHFRGIHHFVFGGRIFQLDYNCTSPPVAQQKSKVHDGCQ